MKCVMEIAFQNETHECFLLLTCLSFYPADEAV